MRCKVCGYEMSETAKFCKQCGNRVDVDVPNQNSSVVVEKQTVPAPTYVPQEVPVSNGGKKAKKIILAVCAVGLLFFGLLLGIVFSDKDNIGSVSSDESQPMDVYEENAIDPELFEEMTEYTPADEGNTRYEEDEEFAFDSGIHRYSYHVADYRWIEAAQDALMRGGYLVHIDTQAEMDYIVRELTDLGYEKKQFMIGARRSDDSYEYYWVDEHNRRMGSPINDSHFWAGSEPSYRDSDSGYAEDCVDMFYYGKEERWIFNDIPGDIVDMDAAFQGRIGYIVEYED